MIDFECKDFDLNSILKCSLGLTRAEFDVMNWFLKNRGSVSAEDLVEKTGLDLVTIQKALKKMNEKSILVRTKKSHSSRGYFYEYKLSSKEQIKKRVVETLENWRSRVVSEVEKW